MHPEHVGQPPAQTRYPSSQRATLPRRGTGQPKPPASGLRVAAGVVALVASVVGVMIAGVFLFPRRGGASTPFNGWMNFFLVVGSIGSLVTGIVILAKQRKQGGATPWLVTCFSGLMVIACLGFMAANDCGLPGTPLIILPFALATLVIAILVAVKGKRKVGEALGKVGLQHIRQGEPGGSVPPPTEWPSYQELQGPGRHSKTAGPHTGRMETGFPAKPPAKVYAASSRRSTRVFRPHTNGASRYRPVLGVPDLPSLPAGNPNQAS